jgi:hypothetical protein
LEGVGDLQDLLSHPNLCAMPKGACRLSFEEGGIICFFLQDFLDGYISTKWNRNAKMEMDGWMNE